MNIPPTAGTSAQPGELGEPRQFSLPFSLPVLPSPLAPLPALGSILGGLDLGSEGLWMFPSATYHPWDLGQ